MTRATLQGQQLAASQAQVQQLHSWRQRLGGVLVVGNSSHSSLFAVRDLIQYPGDRWVVVQVAVGAVEVCVHVRRVRSIAHLAKQASWGGHGW